MEKEEKKENAEKEADKHIIDHEAFSKLSPEEQKEMLEKRVPKKKVRCKKWPNCKDPNCEYAHPTETVSNYII